MHSGVQCTLNSKFKYSILGIMDSTTSDHKTEKHKTQNIYLFMVSFYLLDERI